MFVSVNPYSPVKQDFIWLGEYSDGTHLSEFDLQTGEENSFYSIQRDKLIRFGLIGHGLRMYYEVFGGVFKLAGTMYEVIYQTDKDEYYLTGQPQAYRDIICYKDAETLVDLTANYAKQLPSQITQYNFGYKEQLTIKGVKFNFKAVCKIPFGQPAMLYFRVVANKKLNGRLVIKRNGFKLDEIGAPLKPNVGGEIHWVVR